MIRLRVRIRRLKNVLRTIQNSVTRNALKDVFQYMIQRGRLSHVDTKGKRIRVLRQYQKRDRMPMVIQYAKRTLNNGIFTIRLYPNFFVNMTTTLHHRTRLRLHLLTINGLHVRVNAMCTYTISITTLLSSVPCFILTSVFRRGSITRIYVRALRRSIYLPIPRVNDPICQATMAIKALFARVIKRFSLSALATCYHRIRILVMYLQDTRANEMDRTYLGVVYQLMRRISTKTRGGLICRIIFIRTNTSRRNRCIRLPLVLRRNTNGTSVLLRIAVVTNRSIIRKIILVFRSTNRNNKNGRTIIRVTRVRTTNGPNRIFHLTMNVRILLNAVMTITINILSKNMDQGLVLMLFPRRVVARTSTVSSVLNLLNSIHLIQLRVRFITSTAGFINNVMFRVSTTRVHEAMVNTRTRDVRIRLTRLKGTVTVTIMKITITMALVGNGTMEIVFNGRQRVTARVLLPKLTIRVKRRTQCLGKVISKIFNCGVSDSSRDVNTGRNETSTARRFCPFGRIRKSLLRSMRATRYASSKATICRCLQVQAFRTVSTRLKRAAILTIILRARTQLMIRYLNGINKISRLRRFNARRVCGCQDYLTTCLITINKCRRFVNRRALLFRQRVCSNDGILTRHRLLLLNLMARYQRARLMFSHQGLTRLGLSFFVKGHSLAATSGRGHNVQCVFLHAFRCRVTKGRVTFFCEVCNGDCTNACRYGCRHRGMLFRRVDTLGGGGGSDLGGSGRPEYHASFARVPSFRAGVPNVCVRGVRTFLGLVAVGGRQRRHRKGKCMSLPPWR